MTIMHIEFMLNGIASCLRHICAIDRSTKARTLSDALGSIASMRGAEMGDLYLTEFKKLKDEQINRISYRENLFYLTLAVIGGGVSISFSNQHAIVMLLLLPVAIFVAGISYIACDRRIMDIGLYIKNVLAKKIALERNLPPEDVFEWETYIRSDQSRRGRRKNFQFWSSLILYAGSGLGALGLYVSQKRDTYYGLSWPEMLGCAFDVLLVLLLIWQFFGYRPIISEDEPSEKKRGSLIRRLLLAGIAAALAAVAVHSFGQHIIPDPNRLYPLNWDGAVFGQLSRLDAVAAVAAFFVWSGGLLSGKH